MIKAFFWNKKWFLISWGGAAVLFLLIYAQVSMSVRMNVWYGGFYDILQNISTHTFAEFKQKLFDFTWIALPWMIFAVITNYATRWYSLFWREAITFDYIPRWRNVREEIEGASQRIQEDAYRFAKIIESLGLQIVRAVMTLFAFLPILWVLSQKGINIPLAKTAVGHWMWFFSIGALVSLCFAYNFKRFALRTIFFIGYFSALTATWFFSGYINRELEPLVATAIFISFTGTIISWFVGIKLPGLEYNNQKVEAAFRKELVLGEDDKTNYASIPTLTELFTGIKFNYRRLFWHYGYFDLWSNTFYQIMVIVPFLLGGTALFTGIITLGVLIQIDNAFGKVQNSFSLFLENWTTVTELRSIWKRLHEFEQNIDKYNEHIPKTKFTNTF